MHRKVFALLKKDFLVETSYKVSFLLNVFGVVSSLLVYYFIDKLFGGIIARQLKEFGVSYFPYVLLGMAFFSYIGTGVGSFASRIRLEQMQGTLEALLTCPVKISTIFLAIGIWNILLASVNVCIYIGLGAFLFKVDFSNASIPSSLCVLMLTITSLGGLGMLSASITIIIKRGNPVTWLLNTLEGLLGGVYFPITVMPHGLQFLSRCLPVTYAISAMQKTVYKGAHLPQIKNELAMLFLFSLALIPAGACALRRSLKKAKKDGTLGQY